MNTNKKYFAICIWVIVGFLIALYTSRELVSDLGLEINDANWRTVYSFSCWLIPVLIITGNLFGFSNLIHALGLSNGLIRGLAIASIFVLPMLLGSIILGEVITDKNLAVVILKKAILPGFFEELLFRGFLFGLLFRKAGWGFIPAAILGAVIFGLLHLNQGNSLQQSIVIFMVTFMGSIWFAWLYVEWNFNLWVPIGLHVLMNLSWSVFQISNSGALGGLDANIFRSITIGISVIGTILYNMKKDSFHITLKNILVNTSE